ETPPDPRIATAIDAAAAGAAQPAAIEPPRAPPSAAPARQVLPAVVAVAIGGNGRITVMLEPGELGRVEISIERSADAPQVVILAERPETLALLQRDQRELDRALTQAGLQAEGRALSFGLSGGDAGSGQPQRQRDGAGGARTARDVQSLDATAVAKVAPERRISLSLLDLAI
uniref:flagellar hook-length control protein FliK n=1 Tax=Roseomonas rosulenta TaxID=2748667 RepID=UPI0018DFCBFE